MSEMLHPNSIDSLQDGIADINEIEFDMTKPQADKIKKFSKEIGNMLFHKNEKYIVQVKFSNGNYTATDAMKLYLSQIAELKY